MNKPLSKPNYHILKIELIGQISVSVLLMFLCIFSFFSEFHANFLFILPISLLIVGFLNAVGFVVRLICAKSILNYIYLICIVLFLVISAMVYSSYIQDIDPTGGEDYYVLITVAIAIHFYYLIYGYFLIKDFSVEENGRKPK